MSGRNVDRLALAILAAALPCAVLADAILYRHGWSILGFPAAIVVLTELAIGQVAWRDRRGAGGTTRTVPAHGGSAGAVPRPGHGAIWLALCLGGVFLLGPRLALPVFALLYARSHGARLISGVALALGCWMVVELLQRFVLSAPMPDFPLFGG